ncbi:MAG: type II toxin-antitoxin system RelE/ParE family toxin [Sphingomicrobium sp.]
MKVYWSSAAQADLGRLYNFLAQHDLDAADHIFDRLVACPRALLQFPRRGQRLSQYETHEIREFRVARYVVRYELGNETISVLRIFHAREDRF